MRLVKLLTISAFAVVALGAVGAPMASAEDGNPAILCLAENCINALQLTLAGKTEWRIVTLGGKVIAGSEAEADVEKCELIGGTLGKDANLCKDNHMDLDGAKMNGANCHSEALNGADKDVAETILMLLDWHLAAEQEEAGTKPLQPLLLAKVLGPLLENELAITCGLVKNHIKGVFGCLLLPGLTNIVPEKTVVELLCKVSTGNDRVTGTCEKLCEWLTNESLLANFGNGFEDAWLLLHIEGLSALDFFLDD